MVCNHQLFWCQNRITPRTHLGDPLSEPGGHTSSVPVLCAPCWEMRAVGPVQAPTYPLPFTGRFQVEIQLIFKSMQTGSRLLFSQTGARDASFLSWNSGESRTHTAPDSEPPSALTGLFAPQGVLTCSAFSPHDLHLPSIGSRPDTKQHLPQRQSGERKVTDSNLQEHAVSLDPEPHRTVPSVQSYSIGSTCLFYCTHTHGKHTTGLTSLKAAAGC